VFYELYVVLFVVCIFLGVAAFASRSLYIFKTVFSINQFFITWKQLKCSRNYCRVITQIRLMEFRETSSMFRKISRNFVTISRHFATHTKFREICTKFCRNISSRNFITMHPSRYRCLLRCVQ
jgi:hypothetical protein